MGLIGRVDPTAGEKLCHDRPTGRAEGPPADRLRPVTHDHAADHTTSRGRPALRRHDADHFPDESAFRPSGIITVVSKYHSMRQRALL